MDEVVELEYVGFLPRVWATMIDTFIIFVVTSPLLLMVYGRNYYSLSGFLQGPVDFLISYLLPAAIVIVFWNTRITTRGKTAVSAKIVDEKTGEAPSLGQYIGRYLGYFVAMLPLFLGILWIGFDRKKQGWHDMLSGTVAVKAKNRGPEPVRFNSTLP